MITGSPWKSVIFAAAGLAAVACSPGRHSLSPLAPCHLDGIAQEVLCGTYDVPENRGSVDGRRLTIRFAVLPALRRKADPDPLVILAGGPGQGARSMAPLVERSFQRIRRTRDIVLVDLRGTGDSHPLNCATADDDLSALLADPSAVLDLRACLASLDVDVRLYTTAHALADLDEILQSLGYPRVNLWGGSFGTRAALIYARQFPRRVRTAVFDGAAPFELRYPLWAAADAERALGLLVQRCTEDPVCRGAHPDLTGELDRLLRRLAAHPVTVVVRHPRTGQPRAVTIDRHSVASALRVFLYVPNHARLVPAVIHEAARDEFGPMLALLFEGAAWSIDTMALGVTLSTVCSEDVVQVAPSDIDPAVRDTFLGRSTADTWLRLCRDWPKGPMPPAWHDDGPADVPALILSGALDPVTPPRWGDVMARSFQKRVHLVVPAAAHNASFTGCVPDLIEAFVRTGDLDTMDASCVEETAAPSIVISASRGLWKEDPR